MSLGHPLKFIYLLMYSNITSTHEDLRIKQNKIFFTTNEKAFKRDS